MRETREDKEFREMREVEDMKKTREKTTGEQMLVMVMNGIATRVSPTIMKRMTNDELFILVKAKLEHMLECDRYRKYLSIEKLGTYKRVYDNQGYGTSPEQTFGEYLAGHKTFYLSKEALLKDFVGFFLNFSRDGIDVCGVRQEVICVEPEDKAAACFGRLPIWLQTGTYAFEDGAEAEEYFYFIDFDVNTHNWQLFVSIESFPDSNGGLLYFGKVGLDNRY